MTIDDEIKFCKHMKEFIQTPEAIEQHRQNELHKIKDRFYVIKKQYDIYKKAKIPCQEAFYMALRDAGYRLEDIEK